MTMELKFVNADHERIYHEAREMLDRELERQKADWDRLSAEFERYPDKLRAEKRGWLMNHFAECRRPYEKILTDIVALCPTVIIISNKDVGDEAHT